jgi:hypothetical protein
MAYGISSAADDRFFNACLLLEAGEVNVIVREPGSGRTNTAGRMEIWYQAI